jgi:tRNA 2-thiouridine synthesizing protein A
MAKELDVRGEICPYPMMKASDALKKLPKGETLEVLTDHAPALSTIPWEAAKHGYKASIQRVGSPEWRITLEPAQGSQTDLVADLGRQLEAVGALDE